MKNKNASINTATFKFNFKSFYFEEDGTPVIVMSMHFEGKDYEEHHIRIGDEYTLNFNYAVGRPINKETES